ncbi:MAG: glycoside hydrolase family 13 protein [Clostridia bacterium]|nr:glycoside hydrolase family 13 protein [Clostridia bacterium]
MLTKIVMSAMPTIRKTVNGVDASYRGAFALGDNIQFTVEVPRKLGASAVVLRLCEDGGADRDYPLRFHSTDLGIDIYEGKIDTAVLCGQKDAGLFFYEFLFLRGFDTLFTNTQNQVDFTLIPHSAGRFALTVYEKGYTVPSWFRGKVMYHVFVDRFYCGKGEVEKRDDVILNEEWENGIPQYAKKNGEPLANNMFFGGNLWGVAEKMDYFRSLGVGILYLSPIFRAYSNHKYDTGDYLEIDGMFGGEAAFRHLLKQAKKADIRIMLDGVFNHTGDNSRYFDRYGTYGGHGAYSDPDSEYRDWFCFRSYPDDYEAWWGIDILPKLNLNSQACREFLAGKGGVAEKYIRMGIDGWRLDVADELSNDFLDELRNTVKRASHNEAIILGEVWENAALKEAYGARRRYFQGKQLDSVMNYPFRNGVLHYVLNGDACFFANILKEIYATYPLDVCHSLMNLLGTHDTERILTVLGEENKHLQDESNDILARKRLSPEKRSIALARLKIAAVLQYTVYGVPSIFYGDEAGLEGYHDPFCRRPFPWGREDEELLAFYRTLGELRREHAVFADGDFYVELAESAVLAFSRKSKHEKILVIANMEHHEISYAIAGKANDLLTRTRYEGRVPAESVVVLSVEADGGMQ